MRKRRVLHQACAFSVAVMLVGVNAVPVVAADNNSSATTVATDEKAFKITVTFNYWDYAVGADGQHFLTKEMTSGETITPPTLTVEEGYEFKGWTINDTFFDATAQMSYEDIVRAAGTSEFVAIQAVIKPVEIKKTAHVAFNVDPEKGKFTDPAGAKVVTYDLDETDGNAHPIPKVEAKEGYEFTGWHVTGANEADWSPESETFYVSGLAFYEKDKNDGYVAFEATFKEKEAAVEKKDAELRVHYVDVNSDNYIKDNIQTIKKNGKVGESAEFTAKDLTIPKGYELADDKWSTSVEYGKDADVNVNVKAKEEPAEEKTVEVYFNIVDSEKGSFPDYAPSTVVSFKGIAADTDQQFEIPAVKANDGYKFTGWKVEGAETQNWDADAKTFGVTGLAHFPEGSNVGYVTITPEFEKVEETPAVAVANATVVIDSVAGSFEGYEGTTELHNENLQDSKYNLGFLPTVVANEGYTFKGWKVTNEAGEEIYNLDANATSISFPYGVADNYTVTAVLEKNEEEVAVANATVVIDSNEGSFEGYEGATELHNENLQEAEYNLGFLPTVVAKDGYTFKGWKVTNKAGEEIYNLDANATSISFPYGVADNYTVTAVLEKNEEEVAVANATVVIDSNEGSFEGYEGATELHNENLQEAEYNLGFLPTVVAKDGYTFKGWKVTNKAGEEIYNLDANATSIAFPYGVADDYTVTAVLEKNETPVDPDQPSVDPSKPSTPEEKPGTSIEENKKDDKTSTTVAKDDKKTNKKESAKKANEQKSDTVQTGDHSNVFVYVATLLIAGAAAVVAFFRRRNA